MNDEDKRLLEAGWNAQETPREQRQKDLAVIGWEAIGSELGIGVRQARAVIYDYAALLSFFRVSLVCGTSERSNEIAIPMTSREELEARLYGELELESYYVLDPIVAARHWSLGGPWLLYFRLLKDCPDFSDASIRYGDEPVYQSYKKTTLKPVCTDRRRLEVLKDIRREETSRVRSDAARKRRTTQESCKTPKEGSQGPLSVLSELTELPVATQE